MHFFTTTQSSFLPTLCFWLGQIALRLDPLEATTGNGFPNPTPDVIVPRTPVRTNYLIRVGQSFNLTCPYDVPFYSWTQADQPTKILSSQRRFVIRSAGIEHSGRYVCQAVDGYGAHSAEFAVRVIDPTSNLAQRECALKPKGVVSLEGPCFLTTYSDRDLNPTKEWGESIVLDCDTVSANLPATDSVQYLWDAIYTRSFGSGTLAYAEPTDGRRLLVRASLASSVAQHNHAPSSLSLPEPYVSNVPDLSRYSEPRLRLDRLTLRHNGEYRCSVVRRSSPNGPVIDSISRTFRLVVKPRTDGNVILGERITNDSVAVGQDVLFQCEVNPDEHRSSTIRWGKSIDSTERGAYEASGREVIQWAGGTFVVLPTLSLDVPLSMSDGRVSVTQFVGQHEVKRELSRRTPRASVSLPGSGAIAAEVSSSQISQLFIRHVKPSDAGRYVCSVLTEVGRDDHKFVHLTVTGSTATGLEHSLGGGMKRLTVYIAVPIAVFFICLCVVTYCLVSRRASQRRRHGRRQRNFYSPSQTQIKSASAASSSSIIGVCRNGIGTPWNGSINPRMRPSPAGTGQVAGSMGYASTNGSNSLSGAGHLVMGTQGYQNIAPGAPCMVPASYPMLLQPVGSQSAANFYGIPDQNSMPGLQPNPFTNSAGAHNDYLLTSNAINVYPTGTVYQLANGHGSVQSASLGPPNLAPSSPESSAITGGPGSPVNSESTIDGRMVYQLTQMGQQSSYPGYGGIQNPGNRVAYGYPSHNELEATGGMNALMSYPPHPEISHGGAVMRT